MLYLFFFLMRLRPPRANRTATLLPSTQLFRSGADADHLLQRADEDLAVADLAGTGGGLDRLQHAVELVVGHRHFQPDLGQEIDNVLGAAIQLRSEEHTSELQSLMRTSYAVFCLQTQPMTMYNK